MGTRYNDKDGKLSQEKASNKSQASQDDPSAPPTVNTTPTTTTPTTTTTTTSDKLDKTQIDEAAAAASPAPTSGSARAPVLPVEEKKSEKSMNCIKWTKNMLETAKISKFTQEFRDWKEWKPDVKTDVSEKMSEKNRYRHIYCADANRVVLKERDAANDYIHASWMEMPDGVQFISTQGPIKTTVTDFWHMIYTEKCATIVMLCQYTEDDQQKCERYFSDTGEKEFGDYKVKVVEKSVELFNPVKMTVLQVQKKNSSTKLIVNHFWYHDWHDQVAPLDPAPLVKMYKAVLKKSAGKPIVVHCSAGVGRTATFIGIHLGCAMIRENASVDMVEILKRLRKMRLGSVQSQLQFVFLIVLIIQCFIEDKVIKKDAAFELLLKKYADVTRRVTKAIVEEEDRKARQRKKEEAREAKEREKEAEWDKIREKEKEMREKEKEKGKEKEKDKEAPGLREDKKKDKTLETPSKQPLLKRDPPSRPSRKLPSCGEEKTSREGSKYDASIAEERSRNTNKQRSVYMKWPLSSKEKRSKHEKQKVGPKKNTARKTKKKPSSTGH